MLIPIITKTRQINQNFDLHSYLMSMANILEAFRICAPWMAASPTAPRPNTATLEPASTSQVLKMAPNKLTPWRDHKWVHDARHGRIEWMDCFWVSKWEMGDDAGGVCSSQSNGLTKSGGDATAQQGTNVEWRSVRNLCARDFRDHAVLAKCGAAHEVENFLSVWISEPARSIRHNTCKLLSLWLGCAYIQALSREKASVTKLTCTLRASDFRTQISFLSTRRVAKYAVWFPTFRSVARYTLITGLDTCDAFADALYLEIVQNVNRWEIFSGGNINLKAAFCTDLIKSNYQPQRRLRVQGCTGISLQGRSLREYIYQCGIERWNGPWCGPVWKKVMIMRL